jgi:hypothetical protein
MAKPYGELRPGLLLFFLKFYNGVFWRLERTKLMPTDWVINKKRPGFDEKPGLLVDIQEAD